MSFMPCGEMSDEQNLSLIGVLSPILCALVLRLHACHHSSPISGSKCGSTKYHMSWWLGVTYCLPLQVTVGTGSLHSRTP
jgi:hypothetical protein